MRHGAVEKVRVREEEENYLQRLYDDIPQYP
jgi:hypothetical protein